MATTINSYSVGLSLNAADYINKSKLSRVETNALKREIEGARTPQDKFNRSQELLTKALDKGAISLRTHNTLLDAASKKLKQGAVASKGYAVSIKNTVAAYASFATVKRVLTDVRQQMLAIDDAAKSARAIGESYTNMQRFRFAVGEFAGVDGEAATTMLTKLTQRVGEAALGIGEASKNFERLNLDVGKMARMSPVEQFEALAEAIRKIENPTEQVAMATKFFEESGAKLLPLLRATNAEYEESANQINRLNGALGEEDVANIEKMNDALGRLSKAWEGVYTTIAKHVASKAAKESVDQLTQLVKQLGDGINIIYGGYNDKFGTGDRWRAMDEQMKFFESQVANKDEIRAGYAKGDAFGAATSSGLGGAIDSLAESLAEKLGSGASGLQSIGGAVMQAAQGIMSTDIAMTKEVIKATAESPAIASLEAGTQEAYEYLTQAQRDANDKAAAEAKRKEQIEKNRAEFERKTELWQTQILKAMEDNGFKRFR